MNKRAVALLSGGLDSMLAVRLMLEQGIEVYALNFLTIFCTCTKKGCRHQATMAAEQFGIPLKVMEITEEYMKIVKNPRYGRGKNMNPCIDCRIFIFRKARCFMDEIGASFVVTGEVLGERPMSQRRRAMEIIEHESGLSGLIVRPLSARLFEPSIPEKSGVVDRERLLDFHGRARNRQIELAERLRINEYPCPAGGCLLTDKAFSNRLRDLLTYNPDYEITDLHLLKLGRHFRLSDKIKLIVGRNETENKLLLSFCRPGDCIFETIDVPGPRGLARGGVEDGHISLISSIIARYSDARSIPVRISYRIYPAGRINYSVVHPVTENTLSSLRL